MAWPEVVRAMALGRLGRDELADELSAQVARARALGFEPDHLDSHQHLHLLPGIRGVVTQLAEREGLPLRWPGETPVPAWSSAPGPAAKSLLLAALAVRPPRRTVKAIGLFEAGRLDEDRLCALLARLTPGTVELGCHPGGEDVHLPSEPSWRYGWTSELSALLSKRARNLVEALGIALISYAQTRTN